MNGNYNKIAFERIIKKGSNFKLQGKESAVGIGTGLI